MTQSRVRNATRAHATSARRAVGCRRATTRGMRFRATIENVDTFASKSRCFVDYELYSRCNRNRAVSGEAAEEMYDQVRRARDAHHLCRRRQRGRHPGLVVCVSFKLDICVASLLSRQIKVSSLFTEYRIQSNNNNEITISLSAEALLAALRSAAGPSAAQNSSNSVASESEVTMK